MASVGCSVARAREARESMMRLSHSICTAVSGDPWTAMAPMHAVLTATIFTVNCSKQQMDHLHEQGQGQSLEADRLLAPWGNFSNNKDIPAQPVPASHSCQDCCRCETILKQFAC